TPWNPPYYRRLIEASGFVKAKDLLAFLFRMRGEHAFALPDRYRDHAERALRGRRLVFRDLRRADFTDEVARCWEIYNAAWERNWGFFPMSHESFLHEAKVIKHIGQEEFAFLAEIDGVPAGFVIVLPDYHPVFRRIGNGRLLPTGLFRILAAKRS